MHLNVKPGHSAKRGACLIPGKPNKRAKDNERREEIKYLSENAGLQMWVSSYLGVSADGEQQPSKTVRVSKGEKAKEGSGDGIKEAFGRDYTEMQKSTRACGGAIGDKARSKKLLKLNQHLGGIAGLKIKERKKNHWCVMTSCGSGRHTGDEGTKSSRKRNG